MSATSTKLLQAAVEVAGGEDALATRLGVEPWLLEAYLSDRRELPDALLLRAVDIVLADRLRVAELQTLPGVTDNSLRGGVSTTAAGGTA